MRLLVVFLSLFFFASYADASSFCRPQSRQITQSIGEPGNSRRPFFVAVRPQTEVSAAVMSRSAVHSSPDASVALIKLVGRCLSANSVLNDRSPTSDMLGSSSFRISRDFGLPSRQGEVWL